MTSLQDLLHIDRPIIQAPMAGAQGSAMAIAVSEAGGLGSLPCAMLTPAALRAELGAIRAATQRPFNVNFFCHRPPVPDAAREAVWQDTLAPYYREFGLDPAAIQPGPGRAPFNAEFAAVLAEFRPPVVSFHFGLPDAALLAPIKAWGAKVLSSATTVDEARWLVQHGADAVIAQGLEAGGHRGLFLSEDSNDISTQVGTFALLPQIVRAVSVPVIAAGGIADASGVAAALALGAAGVQVGTANLFTGRPARGIVNRLMRECGPISARAPAFPLATAAIAPLRAAAEARGSADFSPLWAGQNTSGCHALAAAELTRLLCPTPSRRA